MSRTKKSEKYSACFRGAHDGSDVADNGKYLGYYDNSRLPRSRRKGKQIGSHRARAVLKARLFKEVNK